MRVHCTTLRCIALHNIPCVHTTIRPCILHPYIHTDMYNCIYNHTYIITSMYKPLHGDIGGPDLTQSQQREGIAWVSAALPLRQTKIRSCTCRKSLGKTWRNKPLRPVIQTAPHVTGCDKQLPPWTVWLYENMMIYDLIYDIWFNIWHCWVLMLSWAMKPK